MSAEEVIVELVKAGYDPEMVKISGFMDSGYSPSFNTANSRLYLRRGSEATVVPKGLEWFAISYHNLEKIAEKIKVKVFISYPREDLWFAYKLHKMLSEVGIPVYLSELYPEPGVTLWDKIKVMIRNSEIIIVLWTKNALNSAFVNQEIGLADDGKRVIIPIVEENVELKGALQGKEYIRFSREDATSTLSSICSILHKYLSKKLEQIKQQQTQGLVLALGAIALLALLFVAGAEGKAR